MADSDVLLLTHTRILKAADLKDLRVGALCFHRSPLPKHRGRDAVYWTVKMNDPTCAVSLWIHEGIDTGDVAGDGRGRPARRRAPARSLRGDARPAGRDAARHAARPSSSAACSRASRRMSAGEL